MWCARIDPLLCMPKSVPFLCECPIAGAHSAHCQLYLQGSFCFIFVFSHVGFVVKVDLLPEYIVNTVSWGMGDPHSKHWFHSSSCADAVVHRPTLSAVSMKQLSLTKNKGEEGGGGQKQVLCSLLIQIILLIWFTEQPCKTSFLFEVTEHLIGWAGFSLSSRPSYTLG